MRSKRDLGGHMPAAAGHNDELSAQFCDARGHIREAIARIEAADIPSETLVAVLMSEMLPRMVHDRGPLWTATVLAELAQQIGGGTAPTCTRQ